jgi:hypothetical protein
VNPFCAEDTHQRDVRRAFSQHGELGRESGCGGKGEVYGVGCVVDEVEGASQKPPWKWGMVIWMLLQVKAAIRISVYPVTAVTG